MILFFFLPKQMEIQIEPQDVLNIDSKLRNQQRRLSKGLFFFGGGRKIFVLIIQKAELRNICNKNSLNQNMSITKLRPENQLLNVVAQKLMVTLIAVVLTEVSKGIGVRGSFYFTGQIHGRPIFHLGGTRLFTAQDMPPLFP